MAGINLGRTVTCDYCRHERPQYLIAGGLVWKVVKKTPAGLVRCLWCSNPRAIKRILLVRDRERAIRGAP